MLKELEYIIQQKSGIRRIKMEITNNSQVLVTAPKFLSKSEIDNFVVNNVAWINKRINKNSSKINLPKPKGLVDKQRTYLEAKKMIIELLKKININNEFNYKRVSIKDMKTRWGSCSTQKNLNFNYRLIYLPEIMSRYVVIHELCHLREMNHGKDFWKLVGKYCPDYNLIKKEYKKYTLC